MIRLVIIIIASAMLFACSPVRTKDYAKSGRSSASSQPASGSVSDAKQSNKSKSSNRNSETDRQRESKPIFQRFSDTTFIYLGEYKAPKSSERKADKPINKSLAEAIAEFEAGKTVSACEKISNLLTNMSKDSEDYPETLFYASECFIAKNQFDPAKKMLVEILSRDEIRSSVKEQSLVRLGQILCIEGDKSSAERLFRQLRREYPKSIYIPIADCEAIGKK